MTVRQESFGDRVRTHLLLAVVGGAVVAGAWQSGAMAHFVITRYDATIPRPRDFELLAPRVRPFPRVVMFTGGHPAGGSERHYSAQFAWTPTAVLAIDAPIDVLAHENLGALLALDIPGVRRLRGAFEALGSGAPAIVDVVNPRDREAFIALLMASERAHGHVRERQDVGAIALLTRTRP